MMVFVDVVFVLYFECICVSFCKFGEDWIW